MKDVKLLSAISKIASLSVVALIIVVTVFATYSYLNVYSGQTRTVSVTAKLTTTTTTTAVTTATTTQSTNVATSSNNSSQLYELAFNQTDPCSNFGAIIPWSVVLHTSGGTSYNITEPFNSSAPLQCCGSDGSLAYSSIVFSVPNGTYSYGVYGNPHTYGNVTVAGDDVTVFVQDKVASCGSTTYSISTNSLIDNFENFSFTSLIWSNNTNVPDSISNITILTNNTVSCQIVQFDVNPAGYVFIRPAAIVNSNGSFFGLSYPKGSAISYLSDESQDYYYTDGTVSGTIDMTFTLPGHGSCS